MRSMDRLREALSALLSLKTQLMDMLEESYQM